MSLREFYGISSAEYAIFVTLNRVIFKYWSACAYLVLRNNNLFSFIKKLLGLS